jgi:TM2 domain-containing membrane protein YozV
MSVQYDLAPQLSPAQQETLQRAYDARAKNPTTAFLLCYFLGVFGAHRIYLGQWGAAALRLLLPLVAVGLTILGFLDVLSFATFSLAVITLVCALVWEALDLARMDREVRAANAALMSRLLATMVPAASSISLIPERQSHPSEPKESPPQPEIAPAVAPDAGIAAALAASAAFPPAVEPESLPEPVTSVPEPEPTPLTFEPAPEPEPAPPPVPDYPVVPLESASPSSPSSASSTSTLTPSASAYVPPVAPEIVTGGFVPSPAASPGEEPASPPIWPGADAPTWPGIDAEPQGATQPQPDSLPATNAPAAESLQELVAAPPPETPPAAPKLKHIRVRRKIMLDDGTVVGEQVLEDDFPIEMSTQEAAKILEARFQQMSLEEIARQANLPPGTELQLRRE